MSDQEEKESFRQEMGLNSSIVQLLDQLHRDDVDYLAREAIFEHRRLLSSCEAAYATWKAVPTTSVKHNHAFYRERIAYVRSMILLKAQQHIVADLLDCLGYIPDIDDRSKSFQ